MLSSSSGLTKKLQNPNTKLRIHQGAIQPLAPEREAGFQRKSGFCKEDTV